MSRELTVVMVGLKRTSLGLLQCCAAGAVLAFVSAGPSWAAVSSLDDALRQTYQSNPTILSQRAQVRALDERVNQATAGWRPTVTANGSYSFTDQTREGEQFFGDQIGVQPITAETQVDSFQYGVTLSQNVFRGLRTVNETRQAKATVRAAREQLRSVEQQILLDTITAYVDVLRDQEIVRLAENNREVLRNQLDASQDEFRVGTKTKTDVAQAEARLSGAVANVQEAKAQLEASLASFQEVVGEPAGTLVPTPALPSMLREIADLDEANAIQRRDALIDQARSGSPVVIAAREEEQSTRHAIGVARGALLPTVTVQGSYNVTDDETELEGTPVPLSNEVDTASVSANLSVPIYQGGAAYSQLREAKQTNSAAKQDVAQAERNVAESVINSLANLRTAKATIDANVSQREANEIAFEGVRREAQEGLRTTLDVLDAEQELLDSRVSVVQSQRDEYVAAFQLLASLGLLNAAYLNANFLNVSDDVYDPTEYYDEVRGKWIGIGRRDDFR